MNLLTFLITSLVTSKLQSHLSFSFGFFSYYACSFLGTILIFLKSFNYLPPILPLSVSFSHLKPFNCSPLVLSLSVSFSLSYSHLPRQYTGLHNSAPRQQNAPPHNASFILVLADQNLHMLQTPSHQRRDAWPTNCTPNDAHASAFLYFWYSTHKTHLHHFWTLR